MRFFRRLSLTFLLLLSVVAVYAGGIKDATELVAFVTAINGGQDISAYRNDKGEVCLEADIDMAKVKKFTSVKTFGGVFNGQGYALKNWKAQRGLFHEILEGGKVCNLRIDSSCEMKAQNKGGEFFVGWIADINNGIVENCENHAPINHKSTYTEKDIYVGGIVGSNRYVVMSCRNYGAITSTCSGSATEGELLRMGGIAGGAYPKIVSGATIVRCENHGAVAYSGDMPMDRVGGIVGETFGSTTKMCINRGAVSSSSSLTAGTEIGDSWVAGIAAYGKHDVICCDNFGDVSSTGSHRIVAGGVYGMPHTKLVVADCTNYGTVETTNESFALIGGIAGNIGREVHIVNGINRGHVSFKGFSPNDASCIGGVVGAVYTKRDAKFTVYLRRCVNYGKVESFAGGNNYENHDRAIHTGGVVGRAAGNGICKVRLLDCANRGEVVAATGRRGNIAGIATQTDVTGGWFDNNMAEAAEPMADGTNIYGRVTNTLGEPVAGCVVSDGVQCVETDGYGYYAMKSNMQSTRFVYISVPDGYKIPHRKSVPQIFRRIPRYQKGALANFTLEKRDAPIDKYTVIMIGDPQMRGLGLDGSGERYRDVVLPDIAEYKKSVQGEFFAINLGDLVYNWMAGYDDYLDISATADYPIVEVIGNHDYDQLTMFDTKLGTPYFEEYIMPTYYSFNVGKIHYVMVNNIIYDRSNGNVSYRYGLEDEQMAWLEADLKSVPKDHTIYICGHAQLFKKKGDAHCTHYQNYQRYTDLLKQFKRVYMWSGHYHTNYGYDYAADDVNFPGMGHISCITVARCNGVLRSNHFLNNDGQPNGYMVVEVDGDDAKWWYKTVGKGRNYQMRPYSPTRTGDGYLKVNIWNYSKDNWSAVEWWENGEKVGTFEKIEELDPDYLDFYSKNLLHLKGRAAEYAKPAQSDYLFRIRPSEGVRCGEIRVTDNFGVTYTERVEW
ncbi:MAG: calcineurin-like phosphoesterase C-terminal domain-containing protein [Alistipes sp.]|nr:calcineurin-like phosphoesterase C-terminal domain-containing protein [Alistipes sp.]